MQRGSTFTQRGLVFSSAVHWISSGTPNTPYSLQPHRVGVGSKYRRSRAGSNPRQFASVYFQVCPETEQARFFDKLSTDTLVFDGYVRWECILRRSQISRGVCCADCQLVSLVQTLTGARSSMKGQRTFTISHRLSQCDRSPGSTDHSWDVGRLLTTLAWGFPSIMELTVIRG